MKSLWLSVVNGRIDSTALNCFSIQSSTPLNNLVPSKFLTIGDGFRTDRKQMFCSTRCEDGAARGKQHTASRDKESVSCV